MMKKYNKIFNRLIQDKKKLVLYIILILCIGLNIFQFTYSRIEKSKLLNHYNNVCVSLPVNENQVLESALLTVDETNGTYKGERVNGKKEGKGTYKWEDGSIYNGDFKDDMIEGNGNLVVKNVGEYQGQFSKNKKNGTGLFKFKNGDIYEGTWLDDKMEGQGTYTFKNGSKYVGTFSNNMFNGEGTYYVDGDSYSGSWKNNRYLK